MDSHILSYDAIRSQSRYGGTRVEYGFSIKAHVFFFFAETSPRSRKRLSPSLTRVKRSSMCLIFIRRRRQFFENALNLRRRRRFSFFPPAFRLPSFKFDAFRNKNRRRRVWRRCFSRYRTKRDRSDNCTGQKHTCDELLQIQVRRASPLFYSIKYAKQPTRVRAERE